MGIFWSGNSGTVGRVRYDGDGIMMVVMRMNF